MCLVYKIVINHIYTYTCYITVTIYKYSSTHLYWFYTYDELIRN